MPTTEERAAQIFSILNYFNRRESETLKKFFADDY